MLKPDPPDDQQPELKPAPDGSPSFEELMMLVFSGPMCFERLEEGGDELEDEGVGEETA